MVTRLELVVDLDAHRLLVLRGAKNAVVRERLHVLSHFVFLRKRVLACVFFAEVFVRARRFSFFRARRRVSLSIRRPSEDAATRR